MLDSLSSLQSLGAKKAKKVDEPKGPVTFQAHAPSMLPTWLPWALGFAGVAVVATLIFLRKSGKVKVEQV